MSTQITLSIDGAAVTVPEGRTVAAAIMLELGRAQLRRTRVADAPRGMYCGIGSCFDCLVMVDGRGPLRGCLVEAEDGMRITSTRPDQEAPDA